MYIIICMYIYTLYIFIMKDASLCDARTVLLNQSRGLFLSLIIQLSAVALGGGGGEGGGVVCGHRD
jgi:hypothetical protein